MRRTRWALAWAAAVLAVDAGAVAGQDLESLAARCAAEAVVTELRCRELAVTARALQGQLGLLAGLGSEVAGSASTLGKRLAGSPRLSISGRFALAGAALPSLVDRENEPYPRASFLIPMLDAGVAVGVFDGIRLLPTVGGFLSVDVFGRTGFLFVPRGEGFEGTVAAFTIGARVGIIGESFTLPGVSVSASRRVLTKAALGSTALGDPGAVELQPSVTSLRLTVGKDLFAAGFLGGLGWDRYGGGATVHVSAVPGSATVSDDDYAWNRFLGFGGVSMNFLILQVSAELGWAGGFGPVPGYRTAPFDPTAGTLFGGLSFRLTI